MAKITVDKMAALYKNEEQKIELCDGVIITVKRTLPLEDAVKLIEYVANSVVDGDSGEYSPEIFEFAFRSGVIKYFTDIELPDEIGEQYMFLFDTDVYSLVTEVINHEQFESIVDAVHDKVDFTLDIISSTAIMKVTDLINAVNTMVVEAGKTFDGLSGEDIKKFVTNIGNIGELDEAAVAKEVLNIQEAKSKRKGRPKKNG